MENENNLMEEQKTKRPVFLTVLCILTFISSGLSTLFSIIMPFIAEKIVSLMQADPNYDETKSAEQVQYILAGWSYYGPAFILGLASFTGALMMWSMKKIGFHVYAIANLLLLFIPTIVLGIKLTIPAVLLTVGFIGLYFINFKHMK